MGDFPTLRFGSAGLAVSLLQQALNMIDSKLAQLEADGNYGGKTTGRVREFQGQMGFDQDGSAGPITWEGLRGLLADAGYVLNLVAGIVPGLTPPAPPPSWRTTTPADEVALRDNLLGFAQADALARHGIKLSSARIKEYMIASVASPPIGNGSDAQVRMGMAVRSWCSDFVFFCLTKTGCRTPAQATGDDSIRRFERVFPRTTTPKPGDLYVIKFTNQDKKNKGEATWHIGVFAQWGEKGGSEDSPPGPSFQSYDGNSLDTPSGELARLQTVPEPTPQGERPHFLLGSWYTSANTRDAKMLADGFFLDLVAVKAADPLDALVGPKVFSGARMQLR